MTTKLLLRTTALTCALLLGMTLQAQFTTPTKVYNPSGKQHSSIAFANSNSCAEMNALEVTNKSLRKIDGGECTVTINLEYDESQFASPFMAYIVSSDAYAIVFDSELEGKMQGQVPVGTYDIVAFFQKDMTQYYTIKEQVEVSGDVNITLNPAECTNHISFKNYGPDGELQKLGLGHTDERTGEWIHDEDGDIDILHVTDCIYLKGITGFATWGWGFIGDVSEEQERTCPQLDIYVNDVSDRYLFAQSRLAFFEEIGQYGKLTSYLTWLSTDDVNSGEVANDPAEYVKCSDIYKYTPYGQNVNGEGFETVLWITINGVYDSYSSSYLGYFASKQNETYANETWVNIPERDMHYPQLELLMQTNFVDYEGMIANQWTGEQQLGFKGWTLGTPVCVKDGQLERQNFGHQLKTDNGLEPNRIYLKDMGIVMGERRFSYVFSPSPIMLTYPVEQAQGYINDNCPINAVNVINYENNGLINLVGLDNCYVGRNGETRWCNEGLSYTIKCNGEILETPQFNPNEKANYEMTMTNPNIEVDGLPGHNTTTVYFDQNQEDMTPPSIEMLHFKDADGKITDRFATATGGTMEFYASDFHYHYYPDLRNGVFECQPVEVVVEYAPYGTEDWNELTVEEIPEFYQEPGWGYFYRGSLAGVTGEGLNGWFDLRFRLEDASGNWQDQVVSPAFRIDDQAYSSVATVGSYNAREVARYNLAGQRVDANATGVVIIKMSDGTARKVIN